MEAARRLVEPTTALTILREWGLIDRELGELAAGEARWAEMVTLVNEHARARAKGQSAQAKSQTSATSTIRPEHAGILLQIGKMTAREDASGLSSRVVHEATSHGPPISPSAGIQTPTPATVRTTEGQVTAELIAIDDLWRVHHAPPDRAYETLRDAVLPESRPSEVFVYAEGTSENPWELPATAKPRPGSLGRRLVDWAMRAGKVEDLRQRIEARVGRPLAEVAARFLLAELALASRDSKRAVEALDGLRVRLERESVAADAELACQVAFVGLERDETMAAGSALLEIAIKALSSSAQPTERERLMMRSSNPSEDRVRLLRVELARARFRAKDIEGGRKLLRQVAEVDRPTPNPRFSSLQSPEPFLNPALAEAVTAKLWPEAWELLGRWVDKADIRYFYNLFPAASYARMADELARRPAAARYDLLKSWVFPTDSTRTFRLAMLTEGDVPTSRHDGPADTFALLIEAAREANTLDALAADLKPLVTKKTPRAETLAILVDIARGRFDEVAPKVRKRADALMEAAARSPTAASDDPFSSITDSATPDDQLADLLFARACLAEPKLRDIGSSLADSLFKIPARRYYFSDLTSKLRRELAFHQVALASGVDRVVARDLGLALWRPDSAPGAGDPSAGWVESAGHLRLIPGSRVKPLRFVYPLSGTFTFEFEATASGHVVYGGLMFMRSDPMKAMMMLGLPESKPGAEEPIFHRHRLEVESGKLRCWIDGRLVVERDDLGQTKPWLMLSATERDETPVIFRNLRISGSPRIPREVLASGGSEIRWQTQSAYTSDGWYLSYSTRSSWNSSGDVTYRRTAIYRPRPQGFDPEALSWKLKDGMLLADRIPGPARLPHRLDDDRPLRDGDSVRYEFLYEPGESIVHPALGQVVFGLEEGGVVVHSVDWRPNPSPGEAPRLDAPDPGRRLGPNRLPLKVGQWNTVILSLRADLATLSLNGEAVFERRVDPGDDSAFGLFHFQDQSSAQVRNVVVTGDWPETLTPAQLADLTARGAGADSVAERRVRRTWIGEPILRQNVHSHLEAARRLLPPGRFEGGSGTGCSLTMVLPRLASPACSSRPIPPRPWPARSLSARAGPRRWCRPSSWWPPPGSPTDSTISRTSFAAEEETIPHANTSRSAS